MPSKLHLLLLATLVVLAAVRGQAVEEDKDRRNLRPLKFRPSGGGLGGLTLNANDACEDKECPSHKPNCCIYCCVRGSKVPYCTDRDCDDNSFTSSIEAAEIEGFP